MTDSTGVVVEDSDFYPFGGERVVIHRRGKDLAALVPVADLELLRRLEDEIDLQKAKAALAEDPKGTPWAKVRKQLGL